MAVVLLLLARPAAAAPLEWRGLLDRYASRQYETVSEEIARLTPNAAILRSFPTDAARWVDAAGPDAAQRRSLIAATLALEIAHTMSAAPDPFRERFIIWACAMVRRHASAAPTEAERRWYLSSLAGLQEMGTWSILSGVPSFPSEAALLTDEGPGGHIAHLRQRFPDEPRFRLAAVDIQAVNSTTRWTRNWTFKYDEACSGAREDLEQMSTAPSPNEPALTRQWELARHSARSQQAFIGTVLPQLAERYRALTPYETLRTEATVRAGYVHMRLCDWSRARASFADASATTSDPFWLYVSRFLTAWVLERQGDREAAIRAYDLALAIVPNAWSASMRLSAQLFLSDRPGDRDRAYRVLAAAGAQPHSDDPWRLFRQGDARLWAAYMDSLRGALQ
jgi:tetratricopeptide (TPR) repeat protein